jgi:hypothetical protein
MERDFPVISIAMVSLLESADPGVSAVTPLSLEVYFLNCF